MPLVVGDTAACRAQCQRLDAWGHRVIPSGTRRDWTQVHPAISSLAQQAIVDLDVQEPALLGLRHTARMRAAMNAGVEPLLGGLVHGPSAAGVTDTF
jgi:hypothetical protein